MWAFTWYQCQLLTPNSLEERYIWSWKLTFVFLCSFVLHRVVPKPWICVHLPSEWVILKSGKTQKQTFNFKVTVLQDYLELDAGTGTKWKLTLSIFTLEKHFSISINLRCSNSRKTKWLWIRFRINFTFGTQLEMEMSRGPSKISPDIEFQIYNFLGSLKDTVKPELAKSETIRRHIEISGARRQFGQHRS